MITIKTNDGASMDDDESDDLLEGHKSTFVASRDTGKVLGHVNRVFIDTKAKKLSSLSFRRKFLGKEFFLDMNQVEAIGIDIVFVHSEYSPQEMKSDALPFGEDLREFQGIWVYTDEKKPIGTLTDIGFNPQDWSINQLYFYDNKTVAVESSNISVNHDKIVVPVSTESRISESANTGGLLAQIFGIDVIRHASILLQRALRGIPPV